MKTPITLLFLMLCGAAFGQIPSINETFKGHKRNFQEHYITQVTKTDSVINSQAYEKNFLGTDSTLTDIQKVYISTKEVKTVAENIGSENIHITNLLIDEYSICIDRGYAEITEIEEKMTNLKKIMADEADLNKVSIERKKWLDTINLKKETIKKLEKKRNETFKWFPSMTFSSRPSNQKQAFFQEYYNETSEANFLNNFAFVLSKDSNSAQSELFSAYLGAWRVSAGSVVTVTNEESETESTENERVTENNEDENQAESNEETLKRILNGGGTFYTEFQLPVFSWKESHGSVYSSFNATASADFSGIGNNVEATNIRGLLGESLYIGLSSDKKEFNFFANADYGWLIASNDLYEQFDINQSILKKPALLGKVVLGMTIGSTARISITLKSFSNYESLRSEKIMVGIQLLN